MQAVKKKFALAKYGEVSKIRFDNGQERNTGRSLKTASNSYQQVQSSTSGSKQITNVTTSGGGGNHRNTRSVSSASYGGNGG